MRRPIKASTSCMCAHRIVSRLALELLHESSLVPLASVLLTRRWINGAAGLLAIGFAMSWLGDSVAHFAGGAFWPSYFWLPLQFAFALAAFPPGELVLVWWLITLAAFGLLAGISYRISGPGPDALVTVAGSAAAIWMATGWLRVPVVLYFGLGTVCYLLMILYLREPTFMLTWSVYQAIRLASYAAFVGLLLGRKEDA